MQPNKTNEFSTLMPDECSVCSSPTQEIISLPDFPLTDTYAFQDKDKVVPNIDQAFRYCPVCGHGQLARNVHPSVLYDSDYYFRTSESETGKKGIDFFLNLLQQSAPERHFDTVLDLGCNDLYLLQQLKSRSNAQIGIDPIWEGREDKRDDKSITVFGGNIEDINIADKLSKKIDLVVCRHTLEHIADPKKVMKILLDITTDDALFLFEVPGLDGLISSGKFDRIIHQHLQYFSRSSFMQFLNVMNMELLAFDENYHLWGAIGVAFQKNNGAVVETGALSVKYERPFIEKSYDNFKWQMRHTKELISQRDNETLYGYGAAQTLPVLAYHMESDLSMLTAILDDDPLKDGIGYWNLPVKVSSSRHISDLTESTVLVTAIENALPILKRLTAERPKNIIVPLGIF